LKKEFSYLKVKFSIRDNRKFIPELNLVSKTNLSKLLLCAHVIYNSMHLKQVYNF